jgi:hypothetical protein
MKTVRNQYPRRDRWMPLSMLSLGLLLASACYTGADEISTSTISCTDNQFCVDETDGEYDHCGMELTKVCCEMGSMKCGCRDDGSCNGELVCFDVPAGMNPGDEEAPYCYPDWAGDMQSWERH